MQEKNVLYADDTTFSNSSPDILQTQSDTFPSLLSLNDLPESIQAKIFTDDTTLLSSSSDTLQTQSDTFPSN